MKGLPKVVALKKTCIACPSQWEGILKDGRVVYARYRHGASASASTSMRRSATRGPTTPSMRTTSATGSTGSLDFDELKTNLHGLLEFPPKLVAEGGRPRLEVS